jgi:RimJ/RimL family protein N-acetyltransferase
MTLVRGTRVLLRPFRPEEIDVALAMSMVVDATEAQRARRRARLEQSGDKVGWELLFAIEADGRLVGDAQGRCSEDVMPPGVWEIGLELFEERDRGRGIGREAVALLAAHLFEHEDAIRVQATTDLENASMRRVFEVLGFGFEGVLRGFMPRVGGSARDFAMYGMTMTDWKGRRSSWIRTS